MTIPFNRCLSSLADLRENEQGYSRKASKLLFGQAKISPLLPFDFVSQVQDDYQQQRKYLSLSGIQEKVALILDGDNLRFCRQGERSQFILKPIPSASKRPDQMPANEHLTMQLAKQVYGIETAENALIYLSDGAPAYLCKRFDIASDNTKIHQVDFAGLAGKTPQTHGEDYKYSGSYLDIFQTMERHVSAYQVEALKLLRQLIFNYLFSNGDAHLKNFSLQEIAPNDYRLTPAYDLLNTRIHVDDADLAFAEGLLPKSLGGGKIKTQFLALAREAKISEKAASKLLVDMAKNKDKAEGLIERSYLADNTKQNYLQDFQTRYKRLFERP